MERVVEKRIRRENPTVTESGAHLEPWLRIEPNETFLVETQDNFFGEIDAKDVLPTAEQLPFLS